MGEIKAAGEIDGARLPPRRTGRSSWSVFLSAMHAFLLREIRQQYGQARLGYLWAFIEPAATVLVLVFLHAVIRGGDENIYGESPVVFFVFGAVPFFMFFNVVNRSQTAFAGTRGLFNYRQVRPLDIVLARGVVEALTMLIVGMVFMLGWIMAVGPLAIVNPLLLLFSVMALVLLGLGLGLAFAVYGTVYPDLQRVFGIAMRPMFFVSGLFFTIEMIPQEHQSLLMWNPILHAVDFCRDAVLRGYDSPGSGYFLLLTILAVWFVGLAGYRRYLPRLI